MSTQAPPESDLGFPAKGSLKRVPFAFLVRDIARTRTTGNLYLLAGETKKVVFFVDGRPTLVRSNLASEFLGQILTDQGLITQEQCDNTLEAIRRTGKKQGELLVEMGILSEGNLRYGLEEQVRIKLFEIFGWEEGRFQFKQSGEPGAATGMALEQPVEALILAGVQERWTDERARAALKPLAERYPQVHARWSPDAAAALDLLPEEQYFLRCLDGSRTVDELLARKHDPEVPQPSTLLFGLIASGVVEVSETKQARRLPPPRPNLAPANVSDESLAPKFEQLSAITEYEDTPLPNKLPGGAGISSSRNPRVPVLPTEDEEMFRGLDVDESIVADSRSFLRDRALKTGGAPARISETVISEPRASEPRPLDDETDFVDLGADDDDETDFSDLVHTHVPGIGPPAKLPAPGKAESVKSVLPQPPLGRSDSSKSPLPVARSDSGKSPLPVASEARSDSGKSPLPARVDAIQAPPTAPIDDDAPPSLDPPLTPQLDEPGGEPPMLAGAAVEPGPLTSSFTDPLPDDLADPLADDLADLAADDDLDVGDLGDLDADLEVLDDDPLFDVDPLGDLSLGALADEPLPDLSASDMRLPDETLADLPQDPGASMPSLRLDAIGDDDGELLGESALLDTSGVLPAIDLDPSGVSPLPDLDDPSGVSPLPDLDDGLGDDDGEEIDELDEDLELEDVELDADDGFASNHEDTDGGFRAAPRVESAELLGATRYGQAEDAMREGDYDQAVALFEDAYANGYDVAELHAHLAFARFRASGNDPESAAGALELLDWAEQADPGFPMIHAYRGAILVGLGRQEEADECFDRALYLDPENELAIAYTRGE